MKIEKLQLPRATIDINLQFYFFLKHIVKLKPNDKQVVAILETAHLFKKSIPDFIEHLHAIFASKQGKGKGKLAQIKDIYARFENGNDIELFVFSIKLYQMKNLLLQEAKITASIDVEYLSNRDPLSLAYDRISMIKPLCDKSKWCIAFLIIFQKIRKKGNKFYICQCLSFYCESFKDCYTL